MKKLICLLGALMILFTACGGNNNDANDNGAKNGVVNDGNGIIDDEKSGGTMDNDADGKTDVGDAMDNAAEGAGEVVDGATDAVDDAVGGVQNAVDDMTDGKNNNSMNSNK